MTHDILDPTFTVEIPIVKVESYNFKYGLIQFSVSG